MGWTTEQGRSPIGQKLSFCQFLSKIKSLFEDSRYLFERNTQHTWDKRDLRAAILLVLGQVVHYDSDNVVLRNTYNLAQSKLDRDGLPPLPPWDTLHFSS